MSACARTQLCTISGACLYLILSNSWYQELVIVCTQNAGTTTNSLPSVSLHPNNTNSIQWLIQHLDNSARPQGPLTSLLDRIAHRRTHPQKQGGGGLLFSAPWAAARPRPGATGSDLVTLTQAHLAALAGSCMALGLRYAGSGCVCVCCRVHDLWSCVCEGAVVCMIRVCVCVRVLWCA